MGLQGKIVDLSLSYPRVVMVIVFLLFVGAGTQFPRIVIDTDPENMLPRDQAERVFHNKVKEAFTLYDLIVVGVVNEEEPHSVFNPRSIGRIHELTQKDKQNKGVISQNLLSLSTVDDISPEVGRVDEAALAKLIEQDSEHAIALLAEMTAATDPVLAALAARLAGRLVLDLARTGPADSRGIGRIDSSPADRADGDLDLDRSLDALVAARAGRAAVEAEELRVRHWTRPTMAIALLVDRSGSMSGARLATAAVAAAACSWRAPADWSVLAFADRQLALKSDRKSVV